MKIILLQDVKGIGKKHDIKEVAGGYAVNFLLPKKLAEAATPDKIKEIESLKARQAKATEEDLKTRKELADKLRGFRLLIPAKIGEKGKAFGSVSALRIAKALKKDGFEVNENDVALEKPIKDTGDHKVIVDFGHDVKAEITVKIIPQEKL